LNPFIQPFSVTGHCERGPNWKRIKTINLFRGFYKSGQI
jgi:hypothetical protein